jgi:peptidyl-prolyl cis-trans isomerase A (cyclophilin A)
MEVVNNIATVRTGNAGMHQDVPLTPVVIQTVRVLEAKP